MPEKGTESKTKQQYFGAIGMCRDIFLKKARDYGTSWTILRLPSLTDQIYIKAERIRTLEEKAAKNEASKIDEGIESEFIGIINYSTMAQILIDIQENDNAPGIDDLKNLGVLEKAYSDKVQETYELMANKNHDYGEAWRGMRVSSFTDLILMKLLRLKQIEDNEGETLISEGPRANYMDMMNYAVFALIKLEEAKN